MIGRRFGMLVVLRDSGARSGKGVIWECICDCGNKTTVRGSNLTQGATKSCGCLKHRKRQGKRGCRSKPGAMALAHIGERHGRFEIIGVERKEGKTMSVCKCDCGSIVRRNQREVLKGRVRSCGCIMAERSQRAKEKREKPPPPRANHFRPHIDFSNKKFGKLTVLYLCGVRIGKTAREGLWLCRCDCGREAIRTRQSFKNPRASCGCVNRASRQKSLEKANEVLRKTYKELRTNGWISKREENSKNRRRLKLLRNDVLNKHGNRCKRCQIENTKVSPLHIHHYKSHKLFPKLRYLIINNVPLCKKCHEKLHKRLGWGHIPIPKQVYLMTNNRERRG